ncbi:hypothetical protein LJ737_20710 [Hymenobacter sp. 15J16-1T3B]|uniref:hypothetical protein n=1 Tax=Hymenobacter sp. 15J16-1T3B TaxID=2886941 RepID=UPI001D12575D|nr:hypothetical protein [Hymenobacter sp. 15J16-1T3B]MCC3159675.1 hypothetical protein [Hymenobacter sp. 15J16-1T3B]
MAVSSLRWFLVLLGTRFPCTPEGVDTLVRAAEEDLTRFFARDKLEGEATFRGQDFTYLYAVERSSDRGGAVYLEAEAWDGKAWISRRVGQFTLNEVKWNVADCVCKVSLKPADDYQALLEAWEKPVNVLAYTGARVSSSTNLRELGIYTNAESGGITDGTALEFRRIDKGQEGDVAGTDGWAVFLRSSSWISGTLTHGGVRERMLLLFRLVKRNVPMVLDDDGVTYLPVDLTATGWEVYSDDRTVTPPVAHYVKPPQIAGFKPYEITHYNDWSRKYGAEILLLPCGAASPGTDYVQVTGPDGVNLGGEEGANNEPECPTCLNVREQVNRTNCKSLWWRFGRFRFTRGIPLLEALNHVLRGTLPRLAPTLAADLSQHFSAATSYATGANPAANELPGLLVAAASDVKRYNVSDPARKLKLTLKQFVEDLCTMYDCGWFIDGNGKFRIEHRSLFAPDPDTTVDLTGGPAAGGPNEYEYLQALLPRKEVLSITNAISEESASVNFREAAIEYEPAETNTREDENTSTRTVTKLTGDVAGMVLSGDALPDDALVVLAPGPGGLLRQGNRPVSAAQLVRRYHRFGRVKLTATVNGEPVVFAGLRPQRKQAAFVAPLCDLSALPYGVTVHTSLSRVATLQQARWNMASGQVEVTPLLPPLTGLGPATGLPGTPKQFHTGQFNQDQFA